MYIKKILFLIAIGFILPAGSVFAAHSIGQNKPTNYAPSPQQLQPAPAGTHANLGNNVYYQSQDSSAPVASSAPDAAGNQTAGIGRANATAAASSEPSSYILLKLFLFAAAVAGAVLVVRFNSKNNKDV